MTIVGEGNTDILIDQDGQPVAADVGEVMLVHDLDCWLQDIHLEALTEERELFYEDDQGKYCYGFGLLDFQHREYTDFTKTEIQQRIKNKLSKRSYIDERSINITVQFDGAVYHIFVRFKCNDRREEYNMTIQINEVEVTVE